MSHEAVPAPSSTPNSRPQTIKRAAIFIGSGIAVVVAGLVYVSCGKREDNSRQILAETNAKMLGDAADSYREQHNGACPPTVEDLQAAGLVAKTAATHDPWGGAYQFRCDKPGQTDAWSRGYDGKEGTSDDIEYQHLRAYLPPKAPPTQAERLVERARSAPTLAAAVAIAKPYFADGTNVRSDGTALLVAWGASHLTIPELKKHPETTVGKVQKDPEAEEGKRLCKSGTIIEISKNSELNLTLFTGGLMTEGGDVLRFIALGSTGELVRSSYGTFCGIVTGLDEYANSAGGVTHGIAVTGMFDLPANKKPQHVLD